ncbi:MAG: phosphoribosylformylglycinamidine synthase subunit PurL [Chitinophagales bacterium]|nr:phosphoribosylformylglycinamidine synthase subunit PurL [Chitinophagales bacterium]MDW8419152.1 phosphoribosylformylglycinamidine synthase subunit PurL [Chitinophagales bacterium]
MSAAAHLEPTTLEQARQLGLLDEEYDKIKQILGRVPNFNELSIYAAMWSEHCSYKNSIRWLKTLPRKGKHLLVEAGQENAGLVDLGDGWACAFKIESHNHPSALEPYQGAATGVGGIHRDIFTMGARPICALNSLRFGDLKNERTKYLLRGVVKGIGYYGNCFGVPTVAGEVYFDPVYQTNPLVNAMSVGVVRTHETVSAVAQGAGNPVYIVGSATGKDGIHGAAFASKDITEDSIKDLPAVQVGDPFQEKLLLEATLEVIKTGAVVGMQDMGAAGIICSTSEMSAKGKSGMKVWLDRVPTRQANMKPWEILLSESQERMLIVVKKGMEATVEEVFAKWDLHCAVIGEVTDTGMLEYFMGDELVAKVPAESLVLGGGAPVYEREYKEPAYYQENKKFDIEKLPLPDDYRQVAQALVQSPNIASKKWVYEQYDSMVGIANLSTNSPSDAAVIRVLGSDKYLAVTVDCNARYVWADPYIGAQIAVAEAARNIVCSGGEPSAITNCLNFGNPYVPEVYWQFVNAIKGMGAACEALGTPVTGGNVSFYNQSTEGGAVFPTPTIGMLGIVEDKDLVMTLSFKHSGDKIYVIGEMLNDVSSSEYLVRYHGIQNSPAPHFDLKTECEVQAAIRSLIYEQLIVSAHDVSEGGLFVALLESAMAGKKGFEIETSGEIRKDAFLFGEAQSRVVVSVKPEKEDAFLQLLTKYDVEFSNIGEVTGAMIYVDKERWGSVADWKEIYDNAISREMEDA